MSKLGERQQLTVALKSVYFFKENLETNLVMSMQKARSLYTKNNLVSQLSCSDACILIYTHPTRL